MSSDTFDLGRLHPFQRESFDVDDATGCWVSRNVVNRAGYPHGFAHRRFYERLVGPVPDGHHLHHECHNKRCVNPAHLTPVEPDAHFIEHFLTAKGLTLDDVREIRALGRRRGGPSAIEIGERYGLWEKSIYRYWNGEVWERLLDDGPVVLEDGICARQGCNGTVHGSRSRIYCSTNCRAAVSRQNIRNARRQEAA